MKELNRIYTCTCTCYPSYPSLLKNQNDNTNKKLKQKAAVTDTQRSTREHPAANPYAHSRIFRPLLRSESLSLALRPAIPSSCWYPSTLHPTPHILYNTQYTKHNSTQPRPCPDTNYPILSYLS